MKTAQVSMERDSVGLILHGSGRALISPLAPMILYLWFSTLSAGVASPSYEISCERSTNNTDTISARESVICAGLCRRWVTSIMSLQRVYNDNALQLGSRSGHFFMLGHISEFHRVRLLRIRDTAQTGIDRVLLAAELTLDYHVVQHPWHKRLTKTRSLPTPVTLSSRTET